MIGAAQAVLLGSGAFDATKIANLIWWFSADVGAFTDAARTIPVASDGDPVGGVSDRSGNAHHLSQSTNAKRPAWKKNIANGHPCFRFDGSVTYLISSALNSFAGGSDFSFFFAMRTNGDTGALQAIWDQGHADAPNVNGVSQNEDGTYSYYVVNYRTNMNSWSTHNSQALSNGVTAVLSGVKSGTDHKTWKNGGNVNAVVQPVAGIATASHTMAFGGLATTPGDRPFKGDLFEAIMYNRALTSAQRQEVENYLRSKYATG